MIVDCAHYREGRRQREAPMTLDEAGAICSADETGFVWLGLFEPMADELFEVQHRFGLHDLAVEDAQSFHLRPTAGFSSSSCARRATTTSARPSSSAR
jgi:magnesium transporter